MNYHLLLFHPGVLILLGYFQQFELILSNTIHFHHSILNDFPMKFELLCFDLVIRPSFWKIANDPNFYHLFF